MADSSLLRRSRDSSRGRSRRTSAQEEQSSSEYSSAEPQVNDTPSSPALGADKGDTFMDGSDADKDESARKAHERGRAEYSANEDVSRSSEESDDVERRARHDLRDNLGRFTYRRSSGTIKGRRGKKGLTHAEMAIMGRRAVAEEAATSETVDEDDEDENMRTIDHDIENMPDDGEETEQADEYEDIPIQSTTKEGSKRSCSLWTHYHPVVRDAVKILQARGADPAVLGYARLAGAGKGAIDYIVRKQSITIGRSVSFADCIIKSEGRHVSKRHASLFWKKENKEWVIRCLSRKNGIVINGVPIVPGSESISVKSRDLIEIGDVAFFFLAATSPVVHISNIPVLEKTIRVVREEESRDHYNYDEQKGRNVSVARGRHRDYKSGNHSRSSLYRGKRDHNSDHARLDRFPGLKKRTLSTDDTGDPEPHQYSRKRWKHSHRSRSRMARMDRPDTYESAGVEKADDLGVTEDEQEGDQKTEQRQEEKPDSFCGAVNFRQTRQRQSVIMSNQNKRSKRSGDVSEPATSSQLKETWNKKERTDFGRALFAVGVDPMFEADGSVSHYDWTRFRKIAELSKKSDLMLEDYYIRLMADVHALLEEEEREKRTKGPRTKHKQGCDCIVCENTRKSRQKKLEEREQSVVDDGANGESEVEEDTDVKITAKSSEKLVGLVTAQKLRVRLSIHEAASQVISGAGRAIFDKLREQPVRDLPNWWVAGVHDRALMCGTAIHGVGRWTDIWNDTQQKAFKKEKERQGDSIVWPSNAAAMKRVREISSAINAELRREAKRAAKSGHDWTSQDKQTNPKSTSKRPVTLRGELPFSRSRKPSRTAEAPGDDYVNLVWQGDGDDPDESTVESASHNGTEEGKGISDIPTEDDDVLEMEVEEEMEIEDDDGEETEDESAKEGDVNGKVRKKQAVGAADISTDEEEDEEDHIQYETASDSGSE